jgi:hypothetical protein
LCAHMVHAVHPLAGQSHVSIAAGTCSDMQATPAQFIEYLAAELFQSLVNERLFKLSRQDDPPFYVAQVSREDAQGS